MKTVIVRVDLLSAQTQFGERKIGCVPVGDVLYQIEVPDTGAVDLDGKVVFTREGMRHIMQQVSAILYYDADKEDF